MLKVLRISSGVFPGRRVRSYMSDLRGVLTFDHTRNLGAGQVK